jgi:uncharacterized membrane protein
MAMGKLQRIFRHRLLDDTDSDRALGADALARLQARVAASEQRHSGEIRLCVEAGLPLPELWRETTPRQRAVAMFGTLGVWDTEHNNGVLIYLLLAEHVIEIVADRGVARIVPPAHWQALVDGMRQAFREGRFEAGLAQAIDAVDAVLVQHFPLAPGQINPNELPDSADMR